MEKMNFKIGDEVKIHCSTGRWGEPTGLVGVLEHVLESLTSGTKQYIVNVDGVQHQVSSIHSLDYFAKY